MSIIITIWQFFYGISTFIVDSVIAIAGLFFGVISYIFNMIGAVIDKIGLGSLVNEDVKKVFLFLLVGAAILALGGLALKFGIQVLVFIVFLIPLTLLLAKLFLTLLFVLIVAGIGISFVAAVVDLVRTKVTSA